MYFTLCELHLKLREGKTHTCKLKNLDSRASWFSKCSQLQTFSTCISLWNTLCGIFSAMKATKQKCPKKVHLELDLPIIDFNSKTLLHC